MSIVERRKQERITLAQQPLGQLTVCVADQHFPVMAVKDISNSGLNVLVDVDIPERTHITVEYADDTVQLDVYGIVAWRAALPDPALGSSGRILGIELLSPTLLAAFLGPRAS